MRPSQSLLVDILAFGGFVQLPYCHNCFPLICPVSPHVFYVISSFQLNYVSYHRLTATSMCGRITQWHTFFLLRLAVWAP